MIRPHIGALLVLGLVLSHALQAQTAYYRHVRRLDGRVAALLPRPRGDTVGHLRAAGRLQPRRRLGLADLYGAQSGDRSW